MSAANNASLGRTLEQLVDQLNRCQRALNEFLEEKRSAFPRFYFLGDDDLLEIVGQSTNPTVIQAHLKKLFQGKLYIPHFINLTCRLINLIGLLLFNTHIL
jgi:dynein heavy chain 2